MPGYADVARPLLSAIVGALFDDKSAMSSETHLHTSTRVAERRRNNRIEIAVPVAGELLALQAAVTLVNISRGGFLVQADVSLNVGVTYQFRFTPAGAEAITVMGRITHILRVTRDKGGEYAMGGEFIDTPSADIERLVGICEER
jgi:hypothetical protein